VGGGGPVEGERKGKKEEEETGELAMR